MACPTAHFMSSSSLRSLPSCRTHRRHGGGIRMYPTGLVWRLSFVGQRNSATETRLPRRSQASAMRLMTNCLTIFYATPDTYYIHYFLQNAINITPFETAHTNYRFLSVPQHLITITFLFECYLKTCRTVVSPVQRCDDLFLHFTFRPISC